MLHECSGLKLMVIQPPTIDFAPVGNLFVGTDAGGAGEKALSMEFRKAGRYGTDD